MKRILYFFPDNIGLQNAGNKTRAFHLLRYFKDRGCTVDYVSLKNEKGDNGTSEDAINFLTENKLANQIFLLERKPGKRNPILYFLKYKLWDLLYYLVTYPLKSKIPTFMTLKLKRNFNEILRNNTYDVVIISYIFYADLAVDKNLLKGAKTIIDTHDFITAQFKDKRGFKLGVTFVDEIERLNKLDDVWAISPEEQYLFSQFCKAQVHLVPLMMDQPNLPDNKYAEKKYDLIYVASDNVNNINSARWFFDEVYPLLPAGLNICVIGRINEHLTSDYEIECIHFVESLIPYYSNARVALCPMLKGTGIKVKVVEAMAFGLPVVCTTRGTDGLPNKCNNGCLVSDNAITFAQNIITLLSDRELYQKIQQLSRQSFNSNFSEPAVFNMLDNILKLVNKTGNV